MSSPQSRHSSGDNYLHHSWVWHKSPETNKWDPIWLALRDNILFFFISAETHRLENHIATVYVTKDTTFHNTTGNLKDGFKFELHIGKKKRKFKVKTAYERELWRGYLEGVITGSLPQGVMLSPADSAELTEKLRHVQLSQDQNSAGGTGDPPALPRVHLRHSQTQPNLPSAAGDDSRGLQNSRVLAAPQRRPSASSLATSGVSLRSGGSSSGSDNTGMSWDAMEASEARRRAAQRTQRSISFSQQSRDSGSFSDYRSNGGGPVMQHKFSLDGTAPTPSWFFKEASRDIAEKVLKGNPHRGNTLMRVSSTARNQGSYVICKIVQSRSLSVGCDTVNAGGRLGTVQHYEIIRVAEGFKINVDNCDTALRTLTEVMECFVRLAGPATKPMTCNDLPLLGIEEEEVQYWNRTLLAEAEDIPSCHDSDESDEYETPRGTYQPTDYAPPPPVNAPAPPSLCGPSVASPSGRAPMTPTTPTRSSDPAYFSSSSSSPLSSSLVFVAPPAPPAPPPAPGPGGRQPGYSTWGKDKAASVQTKMNALGAKGAKTVGPSDRKPTRPDGGKQSAMDVHRQMLQEQNVVGNLDAILRREEARSSRGVPSNQPPPVPPVPENRPKLDGDLDRHVYENQRISGGPKDVAGHHARWNHRSQSVPNVDVGALNQSVSAFTSPPAAVRRGPEGGRVPPPTAPKTTSPPNSARDSTDGVKDAPSDGTYLVPARRISLPICRLRHLHQRWSRRRSKVPLPLPPDYSSVDSSSHSSSSDDDDDGSEADPLSGWTVVGFNADNGKPAVVDSSTRNKKNGLVKLMENGSPSAVESSTKNKKSGLLKLMENESRAAVESSAKNKKSGLLKRVKSGRRAVVESSARNKTSGLLKRKESGRRPVAESSKKKKSVLLKNVDTDTNLRRDRDVVKSVERKLGNELTKEEGTELSNEGERASFLKMQGVGVRQEKDGLGRIEGEVFKTQEASLGLELSAEEERPRKDAKAVHVTKSEGSGGPMKKGNMSASERLSLVAEELDCLSYSEILFETDPLDSVETRQRLALPRDLPASRPVSMTYSEIRIEPEREEEVDKQNDPPALAAASLLKTSKLKSDEEMKVIMVKTGREPTQGKAGVSAQKGLDKKESAKEALTLKGLRHRAPVPLPKEAGLSPRRTGTGIRQPGVGPESLPGGTGTVGIKTQPKGEADTSPSFGTRKRLPEPEVKDASSPRRAGAVGIKTQPEAKPDSSPRIDTRKRQPEPEVRGESSPRRTGAVGIKPQPKGEADTLPNIDTRKRLPEPEVKDESSPRPTGAVGIKVHPKANPDSSPNIDTRKRLPEPEVRDESSPRRTGAAGPKTQPEAEAYSLPYIDTRKRLSEPEVRNESLSRRTAGTAGIKTRPKADADSSPMIDTRKRPPEPEARQPEVAAATAAVKEEEGEEETACYLELFGEDEVIYDLMLATGKGTIGFWPPPPSLVPPAPATGAATEDNEGDMLGELQQKILQGRGGLKHVAGAAVAEELRGSEPQPGTTAAAAAAAADQHRQQTLALPGDQDDGEMYEDLENYYQNM